MNSFIDTWPEIIQWEWLVKDSVQCWTLCWVAVYWGDTNSPGSSDWSQGWGPPLCKKFLAKFMLIQIRMITWLPFFLKIQMLKKTCTSTFDVIYSILHFFWRSVRLLSRLRPPWDLRHLMRKLIKLCPIFSRCPFNMLSSPSLHLDQYDRRFPVCYVFWWRFPKYKFPWLNDALCGRT